MSLQQHCFDRLRFYSVTVLISVFINNPLFALQCILHVTVRLCFISSIAQEPLSVCLVLCITYSIICY